MTMSYKTEMKEGNVLFTDELNTFYLWLYGVRYMIKDHSDNKRGNPLLPHGQPLVYQEYQNIKGDRTCGGPLVVEAPGQPSVVELWRPTLPKNTKI